MYCLLYIVVVDEGVVQAVVRLAPPPLVLHHDPHAAAQGVAVEAVALAPVAHPLLARRNHQNKTLRRLARKMTRLRERPQKLILLINHHQIRNSQRKRKPCLLPLLPFLLLHPSSKRKIKRRLRHPVLLLLLLLLCLHPLILVPSLGQSHAPVPSLGQSHALVLVHQVAHLAVPSHGRGFLVLKDPVHPLPPPPSVRRNAVLPPNQQRYLWAS